MSDRGGAGEGAGGVALLSRAVTTLAALDLDVLAVAELQTLTGQVHAPSDRLAGVTVALVGALQVRSGGTVLVRHWLRDRTGCHASAAGVQVRLAADLRQLPLVLAAVLDGRVGLAQARVLCRLVDQIEPAALADAEPNLIAVAAQRDPQALAAWVRELLATWCEPQFDADMRSQEHKRYLQSWRNADGMLSGRFRLMSADAEAFLTLLEPLARPAGLADPRSAGQRRADALVEACQQVLAFGDLPDAGGLRPQVSYVVPAGWAAGNGPVGTFADLVGHSLASHVLGDLRAAIPVEHSCAIGAWTGPQDPQPDRDDPVRRPPHPRPARPAWTGQGPGSRRRHHQPHPTPSPRRVRSRLRRPRLHPTPRLLRRPPPHPPRRRRRNQPQQPRAALPPAPHPLAPRTAHLHQLHTPWIDGTPTHPEAGRVGRTHGTGGRSSL